MANKKSKELGTSGNPITFVELSKLNWGKYINCVHSLQFTTPRIFPIQVPGVWMYTPPADYDRLDYDYLFRSVASWQLALTIWGTTATKAKQITLHWFTNYNWLLLQLLELLRGCNLHYGLVMMYDRTTRLEWELKSQTMQPASYWQTEVSSINKERLARAMALFPKMLIKTVEFRCPAWAQKYRNSSEGISQLPALPHGDDRLAALTSEMLAALRPDQNSFRRRIMRQQYAFGPNVGGTFLRLSYAVWCALTNYHPKMSNLIRIKKKRWTTSERLLLYLLGASQIEKLTH